MIRRITTALVFAASCQLVMADQAFDALMAKANSGDTYSQYQVAEAFYLGKGAPQDYKQAALWYKKAAEDGEEVESQYSLGVMYARGEGLIVYMAMV